MMFVAERSFEAGEGLVEQQQSRAGNAASVRARATRWRSPPESSVRHFCGADG